MTQKNEKLQLRFLQENDIEKCAELTRRMWPDSPRVQRHIKHELTDPRAIYITAHIDDVLVGYAGYQDTMLNYDIYEFIWCNVDPAYQGQGIGRKLVENRIDLIKLSHGRVILLTTTSPHIYTRYGFKSLSNYKLYDPKPFYLISLELDNDLHEK